VYAPSRWLVRLALLHLALGTLIGAALLVAKSGWAPAELFALRGVHREMLTVGWLVQFAVGVGSWVLPPVRALSIRGRPMWAVAVLLNAGVLAVAVATAFGPGPVAVDGLRVGGRALEAAGLAVFAWPVLTRSFR